MVSTAVKQSQWSLIDQFEKIAKTTNFLNEEVLDENNITKAELNVLEESLRQIKIKVDKIDTDASSFFWRFLALISFILTLWNETRVWQPKPEYATKQEIETIIKEQFTIYEKELKNNKEYRITNRICKIMLKKQLKSLVIEKLPIDFEVVILQVNHKWIYASYVSPKDNLPKSGWIMKKYLDKLK